MATCVLWLNIEFADVCAHEGMPVLTAHESCGRLALSSTPFHHIGSCLPHQCPILQGVRDLRGSGAVSTSARRTSPIHIKASLGTGNYGSLLQTLGMRLWAIRARLLFTLRAATVNALPPDCLLIAIGDGVDCLLIAKQLVVSGQRTLDGLPPYCNLLLAGSTQVLDSCFQSSAARLSALWLDVSTADQQISRCWPSTRGPCSKLQDFKLRYVASAAGASS